MRGRKVLMAWLSRVGHTRLESSTTQRPDGGSTQIEQPVKPRWPTPERGQWRPAEEPSAAGRSQPRHQVEPGTPEGEKKRRTVSGRTRRRAGPPSLKLPT